MAWAFWFGSRRAAIGRTARSRTFQAPGTNVRHPGFPAAKPTVGFRPNRAATSKAMGRPLSGVVNRAANRGNQAQIFAKPRLSGLRAMSDEDIGKRGATAVIGPHALRRRGGPRKIPSSANVYRPCQSAARATDGRNSASAMVARHVLGGYSRIRSVHPAKVLSPRAGRRSQPAPRRGLRRGNR